MSPETHADLAKEYAFGGSVTLQGIWKSSPADCRC